MKLAYLTEMDEKRAIRTQQRLDRIDFVVAREGTSEERIASLKKEKRRRELELELLDLRSEEAFETGGDPKPRGDSAGSTLTAAATEEA